MGPERRSFMNYPLKVAKTIYYSIFFHFVKQTLDTMLPNLHVCNIIRGFVVGRLFLKNYRARLAIASGVTIITPQNLEVGEDVYIAHNVWINATGGLSLGSGVVISPLVVIATSKHLYGNGRVSVRQSCYQSISIGDGSWVSSGCVVTMGVRVGRGVILGANSVVTRDIEDYTFATGAPAKKVRELPADR